MQHARYAMLKQCNIAQFLRLLPFKMEAGWESEGGPFDQEVRLGLGRTLAGTY
jgi:hypothetical protein